MENSEPEQVTQPEVAPDPRDAEIASLRQRLDLTVGAYRASIVKLNPDLPPEMLAGDTLEALDESVAKARALVSKVKQTIEAERAASKVPAGSPLRGETNLSSLSPREKIQYGIGGK